MSVDRWVMVVSALLLCAFLWSLARNIGHLQNDSEELLRHVCLLQGVDRQKLRDGVVAFVSDPPPAQQGPSTNPIRAVTTDTNPAAVVLEQQPAEEWRGRFAFTAGSGSTASRHRRRR